MFRESVKCQAFTMHMQMCTGKRCMGTLVSWFYIPPEKKGLVYKVEDNAARKSWWD